MHNVLLIFPSNNPLLKLTTPINDSMPDAAYASIICRLHKKYCKLGLIWIYRRLESNVLKHQLYQKEPNHKHLFGSLRKIHHAISLFTQRFFQWGRELHSICDTLCTHLMCSTTCCTPQAMTFSQRA